MIRILTIDRPPVNALNDETVSELREAVKSAMEDKEIRVLVITGSKEIFVAGADLEVLAKADQDIAREVVSRVKFLHHEIQSGPKPVLAAINGVAAGGGLELAMACDVRIADKNARLGLPEVTLGVMPGAGGTQMLPRLIGIGKALELMLSGTVITADEALALGLIEHIAAEGNALTLALKTAEKMAQNAPLAMAEIKQAAYDSLSLSLTEGLERETERFARLCETDDKSEGIAAFKAKRLPIFRGH